MTFNELKKIFELYQIPDDVKLESDSGWECGATNMNGIYYNSKENTVVFTQSFGDCDDYFTREYEWLPLITYDLHGECLKAKGGVVWWVEMVWGKGDVWESFNEGIYLTPDVPQRIVDKEDCIERHCYLREDFAKFLPDGRVVVKTHFVGENEPIFSKEQIGDRMVCWGARKGIR